MILKPFFGYFGGKYRIAPHYPEPKYPFIVELFAGSAGYSVRHWRKQVILLEKDPKVFLVWQYLINVSSSEILSLPLHVPDSIHQLDVCQEAKYLIGFWLSKGRTQPANRSTTWMKSGLYPKCFWGPEVRHRIANQVNMIRHWKIENCGYEDAGPFDMPATWFIDPPYVKAGKSYRFGSSQIDYSHLSKVCTSLKGQTIVCEAEGAEWLPFVTFRTAKAMSHKGNASRVSKEVMYYRESK